MAATIDEESLDTASENTSGERTPLLQTDGSSTSSTLLNHEGILKDGASLEDSLLPEKSTLGRRIGWSSAYILVISRVIGSGIFAMPGVVLSEVGSIGLGLSLWVVGALIAWAGLAISIEYGAMLPRSGGVKVYLEYTYRWPRFLASTLVAVNAVLLGFTASNCIIFAKYILYANHKTPDDFWTKILAVGLLTFITIVHGCFYRSGIWLQNALGWLKIGLTIFMILTGFAALFQTSKYTAPDWHELWAGSNWEWNTISTAFFKVLYSYAGLENVNNVMNEVKNPIRTVKTVGPAGLLTASLLYVLINIAYLVVVPVDEVKQSRELIAALFFEKLGFGRVFLPAAIALSAAGNVMVVTFSLARLNQEVARQGFLPFPRLLASNAPFGSPTGGLVVHYFPSLLVIVLPPSDTVYAFIANIENYAGQFFALAIAAGLLILRNRESHVHRPFKAWLPAVWVRIGLAIFLILAPLFPSKDRQSATYALVGLAVVIFGVIYWFVLTIAWPYLWGYTLEEATEKLDDGMPIMRLVRRPVKDSRGSS